MSSTEDDQLAEFKDWWQRNGKPLVTGGLLALVVVFGWQAFQKYQSNQSQGASMLYQQLLETTLTPTGKPDPAQVADLAGKLKTNLAVAPTPNTAACSSRKSRSIPASWMTQPPNSKPSPTSRATRPWVKSHVSAWPRSWLHRTRPTKH